MNKDHKTSVFQTRRFKSGGYTVLVSVIVVLVVVAVNLFVGQLPTTVTKIDTTTQKLYTFSEQTEQLLKNLKDDVTLTLVAGKRQRGCDHAGAAQPLQSAER